MRLCEAACLSLDVQGKVHGNTLTQLPELRNPLPVTEWAEVSVMPPSVLAMTAKLARPTRYHPHALSQCGLLQGQPRPRFSGIFRLLEHSCGR